MPTRSAAPCWVTRRRRCWTGIGSSIRTGRARPRRVHARTVLIRALRTNLGQDPARWGFEEAGVTFVPRISLPEAERLMVEHVRLLEADYSAYGALMDEVRQAHGLNGLTQLLGYPAE